jgi:hypothetical protein
LLQADQGVFGMVAVRSGNVDGIDRGVGCQFFVSVVDLLGAVCRGEAACAIGVAGCNGMKANVAGQPQGESKLVGDFFRGR